MSLTTELGNAGTRRSNIEKRSWVDKGLFALRDRRCRNLLQVQIDGLGRCLLALGSRMTLCLPSVS